MSDQPAWTLLADYGAQFEADLAAGLLESAEIPVLRKGPEVGVFGPGFAGATSRGVQLFVPAARLAEAREVLETESDPSGDQGG